MMQILHLDRTRGVTLLPARRVGKLARRRAVFARFAHERRVHAVMGLARTVAAVFGAVYLLVGIVGFILESPLLGLFEINALHNVVHVLLGAILLYGSMSSAAAVQTTRGVGALLVVLGLLGFVIPDGFGLVPLGGNDIWLHLATGAILLATGFLATEGSAATV
jgi:hypothetical protein